MLSTQAGQREGWPRAITASESLTITVIGRDTHGPKSSARSVGGHWTGMYISRTVATHDAGDPSVPRRAIALPFQGW